MSQLGACVDGTLTWIGNNKLAFFLGLVAFSLMVSTWTLAAVNSNLNHEVNGLKQELSDITSTVTSTTGSTTSESTTSSTSNSSEETTTEPEITDGQKLRLSEFITPTLYELLLHPDLTPGDDGGRFTGNVKIYLDIQETTSEIILHSNELNISSVTFTGPDDVRVLNFQLITELEQLKVTLSNTINIGSDYILEIDFNGSLRDKIVGFYSSTYKDEDGNDR